MPVTYPSYTPIGPYLNVVLKDKLSLLYDFGYYNIDNTYFNGIEKQLSRVYLNVDVEQIIDVKTDHNLVTLYLLNNGQLAYSKKPNATSLIDNSNIIGLNFSGSFSKIYKPNVLFSSEVINANIPLVFPVVHTSTQRIGYLSFGVSTSGTHQFNVSLGYFPFYEGTYSIRPGSEIGPYFWMFSTDGSGNIYAADDLGFWPNLINKDTVFFSDFPNATQKEVIDIRDQFALVKVDGNYYIVSCITTGDKRLFKQTPIGKLNITADVNDTLEILDFVYDYGTDVSIDRSVVFDSTSTAFVVPIGYKKQGEGTYYKLSLHMLNPSNGFPKDLYLFKGYKDTDTVYSPVYNNNDDWEVTLNINYKSAYLFLSPNTTGSLYIVDSVGRFTTVYSTDSNKDSVLNVPQNNSVTLFDVTGSGNYYWDLIYSPPPGVNPLGTGGYIYGSMPLGSSYPIGNIPNNLSALSTSRGSGCFSIPGILGSFVPSGYGVPYCVGNTTDENIIAVSKWMFFRDYNTILKPGSKITTESNKDYDKAIFEITHPDLEEIRRSWPNLHIKADWLDFKRETKKVLVKLINQQNPLVNKSKYWFSTYKVVAKKLSIKKSLFILLDKLGLI